ncbi:Protein ltv1, partial [Oleoguttula sp. CCFEE 5521]
MPRRKPFDKKSATTFALVHRAQNDPLINDDEAPSMVFAEKQTRHVPDEDFNALPSSSSASAFSSTSTRSRKVKQRGDLEEEFGVAFRPNEGQAAEHGVFFDDTQYDYMQHMRDLGTGQGPVTWVPAARPKEKGKGKQKLEDALRDMDIEGSDDLQSVGQSSMASSVARSLLPEEVLPSEFVMRRSYQDQQDVPDEIAGFQPDMDPRLREALEALEDEEYVDDEDDDLFGELTKEGREVEIDEWERLGEQQMFTEGEAELDDGWESDVTVTAKDTSKREALPLPQLSTDETPTAPTDVQAEPPADPTFGAWFDEFKKF